MKLAIYMFSVAVLCGCGGGSHPTFNDDDAAAPQDDAGSMTNDLCAAGYPQGPYGTSVGKVVNPGLQWKGYLANTTTVTSITANDLWDCDGSQGTNAIEFDVAATWCAACQSEATNMPMLFAKNDALGIRVVTLMVQDESMAPATTSTAQAWLDQYKLTDETVCADPAFSFAPTDGSTSVNLPMTIIVDPRTMKIMKVEQGYLAAYPLEPDAEAVAIAQKNGAM